MNIKKCPFCGNHECIRKGLQDGHQRWQCKRCHKKFQANKTAPLSKEELFCLYVFNKQTLNELKDEYHVRTKELQKIFDEIVLPKKVHEPRSITLCVDATFFGDFGVVVFRDQKKKEDLSSRENHSFEWFMVIYPSETPECTEKHEVHASISFYLSKTFSSYHS